ncbi:MAG: iron-sulfur cluster assembly scaffold protein [Novosphingobium sp.]
MTGAPIKLYTPEVLALATQLARWPIDPAMPLQGRARSQSCGSVLAMSLALDDAGAIQRIGLSTQACAIGQASAAIFADQATGKTRTEVAGALAALDAWLKGERSLPEWPGLSTIAAAKDYPARHGAVLLPWKSALDALP